MNKEEKKLSDIEKEKKAERRGRYLYVASEIRVLKNQQWATVDIFFFNNVNNIIVFTKSHF